MSRLNNSQLFIFGTTFLAVSLIGNVMLFVGNSSKTKELSELTTSNKELETKLTTFDFLRQQQQLKLNNMGGQQEELGAYIKELQDRLTELQTEQLQNSATAKLTQQRLAASVSNASQLETRLHSLTTELAEANKTVANQQRYIRTLVAASPANDGENPAHRIIEQALGALSSRIPEEFNTVSLTQTANGQGVINIPLHYLFVEGSLELTAQAEQLLTPIADTIKELPDSQVSVIGHADARPIVSDLSILYPTNWELSSVRASKVVTTFVNSGVNEALLTAAGRSANSPVREEASTDAWQVNRRIEIQINP